jgi:hypothetical protein
MAPALLSGVRVAPCFAPPALQAPSKQLTLETAAEPPFLMINGKWLIINGLVYFFQTIFSEIEHALNRCRGRAAMLGG